MALLGCEHHVELLPGLPEQPEVLYPWSFSVEAPGSLQISNSVFLLPFRMGAKGVAGPEGMWGRGGRESFSLKARGNFLWEASQAAKMLFAAQGSGGTEAQAPGEGGGVLNNRRRPVRGDECTQAKWPHSRTSGPPSRPSVYLFTFPGSSNTSAFLELRSLGAALVRGAFPASHFTTPRLYAPCWGGVKSKQQQTRQKRYFGKVRRGPCTPHYWEPDSVGLWMKGALSSVPPPLYLDSVIQGHLGGTLLTSFPFQASESLLGRCVLQRSLGQEKSKWEVLGGQF